MGPVPPRYVYWTILIDQQPTAFRARSQEDLLPTLHQLRRTNSDVVMKWFARGRLWESPEAERAAQQKPKFTEKRGQDWRPGGVHKDPRARFDKRKRADRPPPRDRKPGPDGMEAIRPSPARTSGGLRDAPKRQWPEGGKPGDSKTASRPSGPRPPHSKSFGAKPARARAGSSRPPGGSRPFRSGPPRPRRDRRK